MPTSLYDAVGGMDVLRRLAQAWHARVMADEVVSHAFSQRFHPKHTERLAAYWAEALGGPTSYSDAYGDETSVVRMHSGNALHEEMDRRAITCFDQHSRTSAWPTTGCVRRCTTTSPGRPPHPWPATTAPPMTSRTACASPTGRGTDEA